MSAFKEYRPSVAAFLLTMAMSLTTTALSFFVGPVCDALDIGRGSFTIYYSIMTLTGAAAIPFLGQIINKKGVRGILILSAIWIAAGLVGFSFSGHLWIFYIIGGLMGLCGTGCMSLCANVIVQQSYSNARASSLLGLVMSGSGVGGMIMSFLVPGIIENFGWRMGYRFLAVCWLLLVLGALGFLGNLELNAQVGHRRSADDGMSRSDALKSRKFYLMVVIIFALTTGCGIQQQLPSLLSGYGFDTGKVAVMVSVFSRFGAVRGGYAVVAVFAVSFIVLMSPAMVYPGLVLLAFGMGSVTTLMPILTRFAFGGRDFAGIWSILSTASSIGSLIATPCFGMVYDAFGSYGPAMMGSAVILLVSLAAMVLCFRKAE